MHACLYIRGCYRRRRGEHRHVELLLATKIHGGVFYSVRKSNDRMAHRMAVLIVPKPLLLHHRSMRSCFAVLIRFACTINKRHTSAWTKLRPSDAGRVAIDTLSAPKPYKAQERARERLLPYCCTVPGLKSDNAHRPQRCVRRIQDFAKHSE